MCATALRRYENGQRRNVDIAPGPPANPRTTDLREVVNAVFYLSRSGCSWRMLPHEFPPWSTVHYYARCWRLDGTWERVMNALHE